MTPSAGTATLVVGIDFGTTFSGVSWLIHRAGSPPGQPEIISLWQTSTDNRRKNSDSQKVPSKIYYDKDGSLSWGFKIPAGVEAIEWFKLLLLNNNDLQDHLQESSHLHDAQQSLRRLGQSPVQLVADYLKVLWDHALGQICNAKGQDLINGMPFYIVLTVPAIWTDYARDRMRQAAGLAGILKPRLAGDTILSFVSEPEAAAIATMPEVENRGDLQVGDSFVVVDAGGGTVDIISYKLNKAEPLSVSECVEGQGALCGGTFLDKEFEALLKRYIGKASWDKMTLADVRRFMNNEWEHGIKEAFNGELDYYTVELPSSAQTAPVTLSTDELRPAFTKVVSQIGVLVKKQISDITKKTSQLPKLVILVGGFGRSPYILKYLKEGLDRRITVLQARGDKPWTAICRGATLFGAAGLSPANGDEQSPVKSRVARSSYGWLYREPFVDGFHDPRDKEWDALYEEWFARNQIEWVVKRGEDVSLKETKVYNYTARWKDTIDGFYDYSQWILSCIDPNPPSRLEGNVHQIAEVKLQTPNHSIQYPRVTNTIGTTYRLWKHQYKVVVSGASFDITVTSQGKDVNTQKVLMEVD
ncbi:hypothetical protein GGR51DRAFT_568510 [Nemania sp. FL0031]|nr:hypothetical protein GGR51DRAFT_568510 [Nemania sp. FL0031]